jgi:hypothetical protein
MQTLNYIETATRSRFPLCKFNLAYYPESFQTEITNALHGLFGDIESIEFFENAIQLQTNIQKDFGDSVYLNETAFIDCILNIFGSHDCDISDYQILNIHDIFNRNVITIFINFILP